jgi:hypothetical protein
MLTNQIIKGEELITKHDALFNADFNRLNFMRDARRNTLIIDGQLSQADRPRPIQTEIN